jgi:hypothetical protein
LAGQHENVVIHKNIDSTRQAKEYMLGTKDNTIVSHLVM